MTSLAKVTPPKLLSVYPRQRLFELLDSGRQQPVIWVSGPPGAGKTTLIASYLAARKVSALWYRCDEGDADPATLFYYLDLAAKQAAPHKKKPLPLFTPEYRRGLPAFTRHYFQELFERLSRPFAVVFDNYQDMGAEGQVHEIMQYAFAEIPEQGRVIVMSRAEPPVELARHRANGLLQLVGQEAMRLTAEETKGFVHGRADAQFDVQQLEFLAEQTQGWAAGLVLLCASGKDSGSQPASPVHANPQAVFDYFAGEILRKVDREAQDVLFTTALMPMITAKLAEQLSGRKRAGPVLEQLYRNNYFTLRDGQAEPVYQYHPLFRAFLLKQAALVYTDEHLAELKRRAAALLEATGQIEAAIGLWREAEDWEALAQCIQKHAGGLVEQGRHTTLTGWLAGVPDRIIEEQPWLLFWRGSVRNSFDPVSAEPDLARAFDLFRKQRDTAGIYRTWAALGYAIRNDSAGDKRRLDPWIELLDELIALHPDFPNPNIEWEVADCACGMLFDRAPQSPKFELWLDRATSLARTNSSLNQQIVTMHTALMYHLLRGEHAKAALDVALVANRGDALRDPLVATLMHFTLAVYQARIGEFDAALENITASLAVARSTGASARNYLSLAVGAQAALSKGDLAVADTMLKEMVEESRVAAGFAGVFYHVFAAWHAFLCGDLTRARQQAETSVRLTDTTNEVFINGIARSALAQVRFAQGDRKSAREVLAETLAVARTIGSRILEHRCFMIKADFDYAEGHEAAALTALREGLALGKAESYINFTFWLPEMMSRLCARALDAGIEIDYARHIIRRRKLLPPSPEIENWPWPVKIFTLGNFALLKDDEPIEFSHKAPKKPLALLKAIVAFGGKGVSAAQLAEALWPDQEGDAAYQAFTSALHRLRKVLGNDNAVLSQEGRVTLNQNLCWVDAWAFQRLLGQAEEAANGGEDHRLRLADRALALYRGWFLPADTDAPWAVSLRERLHSFFMRHVLTQAKRLQASGDNSAALNYYTRGIEADPFAEEFYQGLMRCYLDQGRLAEGLAAYRRLRQALSVTLGIVPSQISETLHKALLNPSVTP